MEEECRRWKLSRKWNKMEAEEEEERDGMRKRNLSKFNKIVLNGALSWQRYVLCKI
jgi:hypothetical protein